MLARLLRRGRDTIWTQQNQARLVRIVASYELNLEVEEVEYRLHLLATILPGLGEGGPTRCTMLNWL